MLNRFLLGLLLLTTVLACGDDDDMLLPINDRPCTADRGLVTLSDSAELRYPYVDLDTLVFATESGQEVTFTVNLGARMEDEAFVTFPTTLVSDGVGKLCFTRDQRVSFLESSDAIYNFGVVLTTLPTDFSDPESTVFDQIYLVLNETTNNRSTLVFSESIDQGDGAVFEETVLERFDTIELNGRNFSNVIRYFGNQNYPSVYYNYEFGLIAYTDPLDRDFVLQSAN